MNKMLLSLVTAFVMLGSSVLAQASPTSGWWEVRNTDQSAAGYSTGWNLCIKADGKWYMNLKQNGLLTAVKGDWVNVADLTLFVGLNESALGPLDDYMLACAFNRIIWSVFSHVSYYLTLP